MWPDRLLREAITFAPQNLLQDPPFSRLDLISCRNLLIYLEPEVQGKVLACSISRCASTGTCFLVRRDVSGRENLFQAVSKKWRIYRRIGPTRHDRRFPAGGRRHEDRSKGAVGRPRATSTRRRRPLPARPARALRAGIPY